MLARSRASSDAFQATTGGAVRGGSSIGGGWFSGGSCSGIGTGSVGGSGGLSILGSGVRAGIGLLIGMASFVLCCIGDNRHDRLIPARRAAHPSELSASHRARTLCGRLRKSPPAALTIKHKSVHGA